MWNLQNYLEKSNSETTPISDLQLPWEGFWNNTEERRELAFSNVSLSEWKQSYEYPERCFSFQTSESCFIQWCLTCQHSASWLFWILIWVRSITIWCIVMSNHQDQRCILSFEYLCFGCCNPKHHNVLSWISHWTIFL